MTRLLLVALCAVAFSGCRRKPSPPATTPPAPAPSPAPAPTTAPTGTVSPQDSTFRPRMNANNPQDRLRAETDLRNIGLAYRNYLVTENRAPQTPEDLAAYLENAQAYVGKMKDGTYVVFMGIKDPPSGAILGYMEGAPTRGGVVLFGDGSVRNVNRGEFENSPKAQ